MFTAVHMLEVKQASSTCLLALADFNLELKYRTEDVTSNISFVTSRIILVAHWVCRISLMKHFVLWSIITPCFSL